jgi:hypothetical protein
MCACRCTPIQSQFRAEWGNEMFSEAYSVEPYNSSVAMSFDVISA